MKLKIFFSTESDPFDSDDSIHDCDYIPIKKSRQMENGILFSIQLKVCVKISFLFVESESEYSSSLCCNDFSTWPAAATTASENTDNFNSDANLSKETHSNNDTQPLTDDLPNGTLMLISY